MPPTPAWGLAWYLARTAQMTAQQFHHMGNQQSGLLGVSDSGPDMRNLLEREADDGGAADAIALVVKHQGVFQTFDWGKPSGSRRS